MTPTAIDRDAAGLLAAIVAQPDDDTVRLAYADWCDENGQPDRAEFIRVQVELAQLRALPKDDLCHHWDFSMPVKDSEVGDVYHCQPDCPLCRFLVLESRESSLLALHSAAWSAAPCPDCAGKGWAACHICGASPDEEHKEYCSAAGRRNCPTCGGSGDLLRVFTPHLSSGKTSYSRILHWHRGWPVVGASLGEWGAEVREGCHCRQHNGGTSTRMGPCPTCNDTRRVTLWTPTPLARHVALFPGVSELRVTDREPYFVSAAHSEDGRDFYCWLEEGIPSAGGARNTVPHVLHERLRLANGNVHPTAEAARLALGRALFTLAREVPA